MRHILTSRLPSRLTSRPRGFTLMELLLTIGISGIVGVTFFSVMYLQNVTYLQRLDEVDAHQDARAAMNVVRRYVHSARWGMGQDANAVGDVAVGLCYNTGNPATTQNSCNNLATDNGADRLRILSINDDSEFVGDTSYKSAGPCGAVGVSSPGTIAANQNPVTPFALNALGMISGTCSTGVTANTLVYIASDAGSGNTCLHRYNYTIQSGATTLCNGTSNSYYNAPFNFGRATAADFYVIQGNVTTPPMMMVRTDPRAPIAPTASGAYQAQVITYDVEDMQLRYGIDTSSPTDRAVDIWCDDPRRSADGGTGACDTADSNGVTLTTQQNYNRIMAVQVTVRVRTDATRTNVLPNPLNPNLIVANPVVNPYDGFQRWIYTTTVMLRNNSI